MKVVNIGNLKIGEGRPKIIIPIVAKTENEIIAAAKQAERLECDVIEWRIDHFNEVIEKGAVAKLSKKLKEYTKKPILVTFRSFKEGGVKDISDEAYFDLYQDILENGQLELLDLELFMPEEPVQEMIALAKDKNVKVVLCNHDFDATPEKDEIVQRLVQMEAKGADICKIAVMPNSVDDVLTLLTATREADQKIGQPIITMSMGNLGKISRAAGELFGSAATFGADEEVSAPGQIPVSQLKNILDVFALN